MYLYSSFVGNTRRQRAHRIPRSSSESNTISCCSTYIKVNDHMKYDAIFRRVKEVNLAIQDLMEHLALLYAKLYVITHPAEMCICSYECKKTVISM